MKLEKLLETYEQLEKGKQNVMEEILKQISSWQSLADLGFTIEAIKLYRKMNNSTLAEAYKTVTAFQNMMKEQT